eukprot:2853325-Rhodomonas_salina.2
MPVPACCYVREEGGRCFCLYQKAEINAGASSRFPLTREQREGLLGRTGRGPGGVMGRDVEDRGSRSESTCVTGAATLKRRGESEQGASAELSLARSDLDRAGVGSRDTGTGHVTVQRS